ncbi:Major facilitator superfamily domain general substrate transporter [Penicillium waksmanii]|uniref:Major facilitator superfamily domain general substrate transporter n=1 Tax=Penicillium waksmanii TaxID=69791 RepID=UPI002546B5EB|nr:Major facilitator superfamily domain general substrate transporter [Penicillium waksmanii]KAJ5995325.1 Major facilitator superfamily domain general substrate transporter [Penicillium waksmanii]
MGSPELIQQYFGHESKTTLGPNASVQSVDDVKHPAQESTIQLFENEEPTDAQQWQPGVRDWLVFICIVILAMMDAFDATVLIPMLPDLANTFDEPFVSVLWINTAYLVLNAASQLYFTMMCDVYSHGAVWTIAVVLTTIGTGICSGSMSLVELVVGRLIQGIGGGGAMSLCFVVMTESTPEHIQSRYSCYILLTRIIGTMVGPVVGGLFTDYAHWTWAFYFNFIFCALGMLVIPFAVDLRVSKSIPLRKLRILDWSGATMAFMGLGGILVGLSWGGISYRWNEWQTLVPIAVGVAVLIALLFYESTWALHPQFGSRVLGSPGAAMTYVGCFCHGFVIFCQLQFFTMFFISTKYLSISLSGIALLAITGLSVAPAAVVGFVLARESQCAKWIISGGWVLTILASGCSILLDGATPTIGWVFLFFSMGLGHGLLLSSYNIRIQSIPKEEGTALSTMPIIVSNYMRTWGMAVAIPVGGVIFMNLFGRELHLAGLDRELINTAKGYIILMDQVKMSDEYRKAIKDAAALALQGTWEVITGVAAVGGISSAVLWKRSSA